LRLTKDSTREDSGHRTMELTQKPGKGKKTEEKLLSTEEMLRKSEEKYRVVVEHANEAILVAQDGMIKFSNPKCTDFTGYSQNELISKPFVEFIHPDDRKMITERYQRRLSGEYFPQVYPFRIIDKAGNIRWFEINAVMISWEGRPATLNFLNDITERKQAEDALRRQEKQLRTITDNMPGLISYIDADGYYRFANEQYEKWFGISRKNIVGKHHRSVLGNSTYKQIRRYVEEALSGKQVQFEEALPYKSRGTRWVNANYVPDIDENGNVKGFFALVMDITERKRAEEELERSESLLKEAQATAHIGHWEIDSSTMVPTWSDEIFHIFGLDPAKNEPSFAMHRKITHPDDWDILNNAVTTSFAEGTSFNIEFRIFRPDKTIRWMHAIGYPKKDNRGRTERLFGTAQDITARKQAEDALRESQEFNRALFDYSPIQTIVVDRERRITDVNMAKKQSGERQPRIGDIMYRDYAGNHEIDMYAELMKCMQSNKVTHFSELSYDNKTLSITIAPFYKGAIITSQDITERKQAEDALRESEEKYRTLSSHIPGMIYRGRPDWSTEIISNSKIVCGFSSDEFIAQKVNWLDLIHPDDRQRVFKECSGLAEKPMSIVQEYRILAKDGSTRWVRDHKSSFFKEDGSLIGIDGIVYDITERKQAEAELKLIQEQLRSLADHLQSVREDERSAIAREIHDEMGQALTGLKMDLSWLAGKVLKDRELLEKIRAMSGLVSATHKTVQRITTELRPGILDDLGLAAALEWQTEEFQSRTGIACTLTVDPGDIVIDEKRSTALFRIAQESLTNISRHAGATRVTVSLKEKNGRIVLRVRDNGRGITKEELSSNTSFGIMGMRERVHQFHGKVRISGSPGKGTTVMVRMPFKD
jgi:PAS domain S-box-containing protein